MPQSYGSPERLSLTDNRQLYCECRSLATYRLDGNLAFVKLYNLLDIRQSESEAFDIMTIASVCTVELVPYLPQDLLLHAYACITDGKSHVIVVIPCP